MSLLPVIHILGVVFMGFSALMATCLGVALVLNDGAGGSFAQGVLLTLLCGVLMFFPTLRVNKQIRTRDGFLLVAATWSLLPVFGGLPLFMHIPGLSFTDAYFEAASGLTTTGATALSGLDGLPASINLWRHLLTWLGGIGIIVFAVAVLPILGVGGMELLKAEAPGSTKESSLPPRIAQTARALWVSYGTLTLACILLLKLAGMNWLDAVCHAFSTLSLGGFSTHDASVGFFSALPDVNPIPIEIILTVFQLIAGMNFATHYLAMRRASFTPYTKDVEAQGLLLLVLGSCLAASFVLWHFGTYPDFLTALRYATFNLVTIATDCGFANTDFGVWPLIVPLWMLFLSCVSVSTGSTGGGIRMIRTIVLLKQAQREFYSLLHPNAIVPLKIGGRVVSNKVVMSVMGFIFLYFMSVVLLTFALMFGDLDFLSAFTAVIACINNAGPGLGVVGPASNYGVLTDYETWVLSFTMLLGRVQVFAMLIPFTPEFWKK